MGEHHRTSTIEKCSYRECNKEYKRYAYQVKKGVGLYCSQRCASKEQNALERDKISGRYSIDKENMPCIVCMDNMSMKQSRYCRGCFNIRQRVKKFNITVEDYNRMLDDQGEKCGLCGIETCTTGKNFAIDHDHATGKVRGLLCLACNTHVGWYERNKDAMLKYLDEGL